MDEVVTTAKTGILSNHGHGVWGIAGAKARGSEKVGGSPGFFCSGIWDQGCMGNEMMKVRGGFAPLKEKAWRPITLEDLGIMAPNPGKLSGIQGRLTPI